MPASVAAIASWWLLTPSWQWKSSLRLQFPLLNLLSEKRYQVDIIWAKISAQYNLSKRHQPNQSCFYGIQHLCICSGLFLQAWVPLDSWLGWRRPGRSDNGIITTIHHHHHCRHHPHFHHHHHHHNIHHHHIIIIKWRFVFSIVWSGNINLYCRHLGTWMQYACQAFHQVTIHKFAFLCQFSIGGKWVLWKQTRAVCSLPENQPIINDETHPSYLLPIIFRNLRRYSQFVSLIFGLWEGNYANADNYWQGFRLQAHVDNSCHIQLSHTYMAGGSQEVQGPGVQGGPQVRHAGLSNMVTYMA